MPMVTPTLNLPPPAAKAATPPVAAAAAVPVPATRAPDAPSTTVTLSPQAISAAYAISHPTSASASASPATDTAAPAPMAHDGSVYDSLKNGISSAVTDVGDAIAGGAHAVVEGVETVVSTANKVATGILELPFAAVAKGCDAVGSFIDEF